MNNRSLSRKHSVAGALIACVLTGAAWHLLFVDSREEATNDAFIAADFTLLAPKVAGFVDEVLVDDNQRVEAGQLLVRLDDRDYQTALASAEGGLLKAQASLENATATLERQDLLIEQARASVSVDEAELVFARHELQRYQHLAQSGAGTLQNAQQAQNRIDTAQARLAQDKAALGAAHKQTDVLLALRLAAQGSLQAAQAKVQQAQLDLSHTRIAAPVAGVIGRREVRVGNYARSGETLLAIVPLSDAYTLANFQENQLTEVRPGLPVRIDVDMFPGQTLRGHVASLAPATGATFATVSPDNATGNFTKVVQRIPVKVLFDQGQTLLGQLRVGMSAVATISLHEDTPPAALPEHAR
ncbi:HlyD family secretion protein [Pseudomonas sp.]|uniref:HlyD family secretion protein n=1 Tax=Pseudomonas sp. TaxID=306 RepID=UPI0028ACC4A5|nr:HlyD family secretion protein [Pseudomonas sp.]